MIRANRLIDQKAATGAICGHVDETFWAIKKRAMCQTSKIRTVSSHANGKSNKGTTNRSSWIKGSW
jgi:hypothetical protein